jgi:hypothetical protein
MSAKRKDEKLRALSDEVARLQAEAEESFTTWRGKEAGFTACMKSTEAELDEARRENARLLESQRSWRAEVAKLRDILKQAVKDTKVAKEALEEARSENALLKGVLGDKDTAVKCTKQELECLRISGKAGRGGEPDAACKGRTAGAGEVPVGLEDKAAGRNHAAAAAVGDLRRFGVRHLWHDGRPEEW